MSGYKLPHLWLSLIFSAWRLFFSFLARSSSVEMFLPSVSFCSSVLWIIAMSSLIPEMSGEQNWPEPPVKYDLA